MADDASPRRLASIVAIDMAGYSRRTEADEAAAIEAVAALRARVTAAVLAHGGRVFNTAGDGFMLEFPTVSGALAAAEEIARSGDPPVRVGVHVGEVSVTEAGDLLGHGVNVAARVQQMASPGAVLVSGDVKRAVRGPFGERLKPQGNVRLDKMNETLPVFALAPVEGGRIKGRRLRLNALWTAAAAVALAAVVGLGAWYARDGLQRSGSAVLLGAPPFQTPANDPALRAFADSLRDQVLRAMNANQVQTVSPAESETLRGAGAARAAQQLGVTLLLDVSIRRESSALSVSARLDDPRRHVTLWSTALKGDLADSNRVGNRMAATVTNVLLCANGFQRSPSAPTAPDVVALFFHACDLREGMEGDLERRERVLAALREVIKRAPRFAHAHAWLANVQADRYRFMPSDQGEERLREGTLAAKRALQLDPKDGEAFLALSLFSPVTDFKGRERLLVQGAAGSPSNAEIPFRQAELLAEVGRTREAATFAQRAAAQNPLNPDLAAYVDYFRASAGSMAQSKADIASLQRSWPDHMVVQDMSLLIDAWAGDRAAVAITAEQRAAENPAAPRFWRACLTAQATRTASDVAAAEREAAAYALSGQYALGAAIQCLSASGRVDKAFEAAQRWDPSVYALDGPAIFFYPSTAAMRQDARFMSLAARLGLVDYWRSTGKWPDFCAEPGLPYDCKAEAAKAAGAARK